MHVNHQPTRDDVLYAFAMESNHGRGTLERYLRRFPEYGTDLIHLSRELSRTVVEDDQPLSSTDQARIERAWSRYKKQLLGVARNPFEDLSEPELGVLAEHLGVPLQVVNAFSERRIHLDSVPPPFLARLADHLNCAVESFLKACAPVPAPLRTRGFKVAAPTSGARPVTFERALRDAGVSRAVRLRLLSQGN